MSPTDAPSRGLRERHAGRHGRTLLAGAAAVAVLALGSLGIAPRPATAATTTATRTTAAARADTAGVTAPAGAVTDDAAGTPWQNDNPYYEVSPTGAVWDMGDATDYGGVQAAALHRTVVAVAMTPDRGGYWLLTANGSVYPFGDAGWYGSPYNSHLTMGVVGIKPDASGRGYWVFGQKGLVVGFGNASVYGVLNRRSIPGTVVDLVPTPGSGGYWMTTSTGAVYAFGDAKLYGSLTGTPLAAPIVGMAGTPDGAGYWLVGATGDVYALGDATQLGSLGGTFSAGIGSIIPTADGQGYWLVALDGDIHPYGDAVGSSPATIAFVDSVTTAGDRAVEWAMAQQGKPYQWGGTGPDSFDCSGLTMSAWSAAGIAIPRVADDQFHEEPAVSIPDLVAGDLVFYATTASSWTTVYHVGMYVGGGHMVDAPYTGQVVRVDWIGGYQFLDEGVAPTAGESPAVAAG